MTVCGVRKHTETVDKHGSAIFVQEDLKVDSVSVRDKRNVKFITMECSVVVHSVNKPPTQRIGT